MINSGKLQKPPIIFFDGVCNLCNRTVDWVLKYDKKSIYRFAPLQGEFSKNELVSLDTTPLSTVVLKDHGKFYFKSDAVLRIVIGFGGPWNTLRILYLIPRYLRDKVYDFIARNRYRWFGKRTTCRLPTTAESSRFL